MTKFINSKYDSPKEDEEEVTVDIDRNTFSQDEIANIMEQSSNISYLSNNGYIPISKEKVRYLDINKHLLKIKMNNNTELNNILDDSKQNINCQTQSCSISSGYLSSIVGSGFSSGSGSGVYWYGLDLI
jgi:hypothetical protein